MKMGMFYKGYILILLGVGRGWGHHQRCDELTCSALNPPKASML